MKIRVCILTTVHPPFDTRIFHKQAKTLVREGYDVTLIAQWSKDEIVDGVKIVALHTPRNRLTRVFGLSWRAFRLALHQKADIYHFHDPELLLTGVLLKLFTRGRVIYDVHEDLPKQILNKQWIPLFLRRITAGCAKLTEMVCSRLVDRIVVATPAIARRFLKSRTVLVQNFPKMGELVGDKTTAYKKRPHVAVYVGGISRIRGLEEMVRAVGLLPDKAGVRLVLAGSFSPPELENDVQQLTGWKRVDYLGWQSREGVKKLLSEARVGLVLFHPAPNHIEAQPNKLFEYMSAGIPVIVSDFPLWREIVKGADCGLLVDPLKPEDIASAIYWLLQHPEEAQAMGERGRKAGIERYNWNNESQKLLQMYRELLQ
ncbi:MAG: glycosyltransferase family 4 protein [Dethiobacteria bacterium]|jgi:glycosyltransferase involved in cell wall biosynthesis